MDKEANAPRELYRCRWGIAVTLLGLAAVLAAAGCAAGSTAQPTASLLPQDLAGLPTQSQTLALNPRIVTAAELEERFGIQMTLLAVTAGGGLIDIRFRISDAAKAADLFKPENLPTVIVPGRGVTIKPPDAPDPGQLIDGQVYFLLYPNSGGAVRAGSKVLLAFGDVGLEYQAAP
jgi:hypothetical protein